MAAPVTDPVDAAVSRNRADAPDDDGLAFALDFTRGAIVDSRVIVGRTTAATYTDATGVLQSAPAGVGRIDHDPLTLAVRGLLLEPARTNAIRNNTMAGAAPGVWPTGWSASVPSGLDVAVVGAFMVAGVPVLRVRISGTTTSSGGVVINYETSEVIAGLAAGASVTLSAYTAKTGGTWDNINGLRQRYTIDDAAAGGTVTVQGPLFNAPDAQARSAFTTLIADQGGTVAPWVVATPGLAIGIPGVGVAIDITLDIGAPQFEAGTFETSVILTSTAQVTRSRDFASLPAPWFDPVRAATLISETLHLKLADPVAPTERLWGLGSAGDNLNMISAARLPAGNIGFTSTGGALGAAFSAHAITPGAVHRHALSFTPGGTYRDAANGVTGGQTTGLAPVAGINSLVLASIMVGGNQDMPLHFRRFLYYPREMQRAEMQQRTR